MKTKTTTLTFFLLTLCLLAAPIATAQTLTVTTNKNVYAPGETILVSGTALANTDVTVQLLNPNGQLVDIDYVRSGTDGSYSLSFRIPANMPTGQWIFGSYVVKAFMASQTATKAITIQLSVAVTGKVADSKGAAVSGATVTVGTVSTTTLADGTFTVSLPAEGTYTIKVEKTGYYTYTGTVNAAIGTTNIGTIILTSYEDKIKELETKIAELTNTVNSLKAKVDELSPLATKVNDLTKTVDSLKAKVDELSALTSKVNDLTSTVNSLKSKVDDLTSSLQSANSEISTLKATIQQMQTTVAITTELKTSVDTLRSTVDSLKSSVDALQSTTAQLPVLYALALVGIIIAVIAIILVYRKIAA